MTANTTENGPAQRVATLLYGVICYVIFFMTFLYAVGFVGNFLVPKTIDSAPVLATLPALLINLALLGIFALQHSIMARPAFKKVWTRIVPTAAERSTYVLFSSAALIALFWFWQPLGGVIWSVESSLLTTTLYAGFAFG